MQILEGAETLPSTGVPGHIYVTQTGVTYAVLPDTTLEKFALSNMSAFGRDFSELADVDEAQQALGVTPAWSPANLTRHIDVSFSGSALGSISSVANTGSFGGTMAGTGGSRPTGVDFLTYRAASFDGVDDGLTSSVQWNLGTRYAFFVVFSHDATPPTQQTMLSSSLITSQIGYTIGSRNTTGDLPGPAHLNTVWRAGAGATVNYGAIDFLYGSYDGTNFHTKFNGGADVTVAQTSDPSNSAWFGILGRRGDATQFFKGKILRAVGWDAHQADSDVSRLEGWAAWSFNRVNVLPSNHPYKFIRPLT